jgi:hypothetical protein
MMSHNPLDMDDDEVLSMAMRASYEDLMIHLAA